MAKRLKSKGVMVRLEARHGGGRKGVIFHKLCCLFILRHIVFHGERWMFLDHGFNLLEL